MKDCLPSTSWADRFCFQSFMSRFGKCSKSSILSNTRPLTQGRLKACQDLVFRSSACEGHFSRMTFILIKAPTHNFQEICCRLGSHWNQICHRKQNVSFPSFARMSNFLQALSAKSLDYLKDNSKERWKECNKEFSIFSLFVVQWINKRCHKDGNKERMR